MPPWKQSTWYELKLAPDVKEHAEWDKAPLFGRSVPAGHANRGSEPARLQQQPNELQRAVDGLPSSSPACEPTPFSRGGPSHEAPQEGRRTTAEHVSTEGRLAMLERQVALLQRAVGNHPGHSIKARKPPPFDGDRFSDVKSWLRRLSAYLRMGSVPAGQWAENAETFEGEAAKAWQSSHPDKQTYTWTVFSACLTTHFGEVNREQHAADEWANLVFAHRNLTNENIISVGRKVELVAGEMAWPPCREDRVDPCHCSCAPSAATATMAVVLQTP